MSVDVDLSSTFAQLFGDRKGPVHQPDYNMSESSACSGSKEVGFNSSDNEIDFYDEYHKHPANPFERPIFYRVVDDQSPLPAPDGTLIARFYPHPTIVSLQTMHRYLSLHANIYNSQPTPFISLSTDLLRAFNLAGHRRCHDRQDVKILLLDGWGLRAGSYTDVNTLRRYCGLREDIKYETEILVWEQVPSSAIFAKWTWDALEKSGIFKDLPGLKNASKHQSVQSLRQQLEYDRKRFSVPGVVRALHFLDMDPSSLRTKQVFEFLLGSAMGYRVPRYLLDVDQRLLAHCRSELDEFDRQVHRLAKSMGKKVLIKLYRSEPCSSVVQYEGPLRISMRTLRETRKIQADYRMRSLCPDFRHWWARREESDLSDLEAQIMINHDDNSIRGWMRG